MRSTGWLAALLATLLAGAAPAQDAYEPDDAREQAQRFVVNALPQARTLHSVTDEDWVRFDAVRPYVYTIDIDHVSPALDVQFDLIEGATPYAVLQHVDDEWLGTGERLSWIAPAHGSYLVRVSNPEPEPPATGGYTLWIYEPIGAANGTAEGLSESSVRVAWDAGPSTDRTGYRIERAAAPAGPYETIATVPPVATSYVDEGLACGTGYYYLVSELDAAGRAGQLTRPIRGQTQPCPPTPTPESAVQFQTY